MPNLSKGFALGAGIDTWGLGFQISESQGKDKRAPGSLSWAGLFNTKFWIDRETNIAALFVRIIPLMLYFLTKMKKYLNNKTYVSDLRARYSVSFILFLFIIAQT